MPVLLIVATAAIYGVAAFSARPASNHFFFAAERPGTQVIAHRGGAGLRPENTLAAFSHAVEIGADILEMDVQRTADGAIVCLHDRAVDGTTDGRGRVETLTLDELRKLDAGHNWSANGGRTYPFRGKGIRVPTLEEVFTRFPTTRMNIEMKYAEPTMAQPLCSLIRRSGMEQRVLVASMNETAVMAFRQACPEVATSMSRSEAQLFFGIQLVSLDAVYTPPVRALQIPDRLGDDVIATAGFVAAAHRRNLKVHVWTVNDAARMAELVRIGVDGIITDRPDWLLRLVRRTGATPTNR
ncbi:MAG: glycerophosphodiester phosphodiesterase [Betaproteobacteria bacterium]|nr:glycerophosphodiester phosphodiesterase [Betaproteobacteria bacterium]